jgi:5S rRNA maturation endonuclease (ribonuclease M5)
MTQKQTSPSYKNKYDFGKINSLAKIAINYLDEIYEYFGIKRSYKNEILIKSCCPIHGGDNPTALNMYYNGDFKIHYKCRTSQCEEHFGNDFISFIRGCLSRFKYNWEKEGDKEATFSESVNFLLKFLNKDLNSLESETKNIEKMKFGSMVNSLHSDDAKKGLITRKEYRNRVVVPAPYYIDRGFSKEVLDEYDVGYCDNPKKPMHGRAIVPIYDNEYENIVGFTARSTFDKCSECNHYHNPKEKCKHFPKWMHSKGFQKQKWLYNYWRAKDEILRTGVAIIVESPGNVWRLAEAGIHNAVAIFGTALNVDQRHLLDESGALSLICLMDNDDAGQKAAKKIEEQCSRLYRLFFPSFEGNDVADLNIDKVTSDIKPFIENAMGVYKEI